MSDRIHVIDNFYSEDTYNKLFEELMSHPMRYFWGADHAGGSPLWNTVVPDNAELPAHKLANTLWEEFQSKFDNVGEIGMRYINGQTFGIEPGLHYDYSLDGAVTVVNYITDAWNVIWGGETLFFDSYSKNDMDLRNVWSILDKPIDIDSAVLPAYNRTVIFPANQLHHAKPLSRFHPGIRYTYMYKIGGQTVEELMAGYKGNK